MRWIYTVMIIVKLVTNMAKLELPSDQKEREKIRRHYDIEKELARTLMESREEERADLYTKLYDELFQRVPYHPQISDKISPQDRIRAVRRSLRLLKGDINHATCLLEIGAGDCQFSIEAAKLVKEVVALDVSHEVTKTSGLPKNVKIVISDGCSIPLPEESVDIAYSNQLMEHLHPDDANKQLINIVNVLKPGGKYFCITPNRLTGPHDISAYFDDEATGFHLKEYTNEELFQKFKTAGFSRLYAYIGKSGIYLRFPLSIKIKLERMICMSSPRVRRIITGSLIGRLILRIIIVGVK